MSTELCEIRDKGMEPNVEVAEVVVPFEVANEEFEVANEVVVPVEVANEEFEVANEVVSEEHIE